MRHGYFRRISLRELLYQALLGKPLTRFHPRYVELPIIVQAKLDFGIRTEAIASLPILMAASINYDWMQLPGLLWKDSIQSCSSTVSLGHDVIGWTD